MIETITAHGNAWTLLAFVLYLLLMVSIGIYSAKFSSAGLAEFFLGGRKMKSLVVALSAVASGRSAWLIIAMSGLAYTRGVSSIWAVAGYISMEAFLFLFAGKRLRRFTGKMDNLTIPDFFESRFQDNSHLLRLTAVIPILIFMVSYVSAQFNAGGKSLSASFGISNLIGVLITAGIVLFYTMVGGFLAVCLTDVIQAMVMIFSLVMVPAVAIIHTGGFSSFLSILNGFNPTYLDPFSISVGIFISYLGIGLGSPGNPHILNKYMSIDKPQKLSKTGVIGTFWNVMMAWGAIYIGLAGRAFYPDKSFLPGADPENIYPVIASSHLHPFLFGISIAAIFAAIMSTADSQLLVASSAIVRDLYQKIIMKGRELSQKHLIFLSRFFTFIMVIVALILGALAKKLVFFLVLFAWGGLGAAFGPAILLSLYWKGITKWGVFSGIVTGTLVEIIWYKIEFLKSFMSEWVPAFIFSLMAVLIVSKITNPPENSSEIIEELRKKIKFHI